MAVSSKFDSIFSSDGAWTHVKLKYNFEGVGSQGKLGEEYKDWLNTNNGVGPAGLGVVVLGCRVGARGNF